jgi:hypothetical protein
MSANYSNGYSGIPVTVRLSPKNHAFVNTLANQSQTRINVYLDELIEAALDCKRHPDSTPNTYQRLAHEAAVCASGVEPE